MARRACVAPDAVRATRSSPRTAGRARLRAAGDAHLRRLRLRRDPLRVLCQPSRLRADRPRRRRDALHRSGRDLGRARQLSRHSSEARLLERLPQHAPGTRSGVVPAQTATGLTLAVLANRKIRGRTFFRTAFYFPSISSSVVISIIFLWMYSARGPINYVLTRDRLPRRRARSGSPTRTASIEVALGQGRDRQRADLARRAERRPALDHDAQHLDDHRHDDGHLPGRAAEHPRRRL